MNNANVHLLRNIPWQLFVTLTWSAVKSEGVKHRILFAYLRTLSKWAGVHFHQLLWACRQERGEVGGRLHFHVLVGGLPQRCLTLSLLHASRKLWKKEGGGWSSVTPYCSGLDAVQYSFGGDVRFENLRIGGRGSVEGTDYEKRKLGHASDVTLAKAVQACLLAQLVAFERETHLPALRKAA